jgi:DNA invertase Pin-like site-specific DNA recombinase
MALLAEAERRGWTVVHQYEDAGISGAKGRDKRPALHAMMTDATGGRFDVVMCWALDRLGRSMADLISTLQDLDAAHVNLFLMQQAIDTTAPAGKLFFHVLGTVRRIRDSLVAA